MKKYINNNKNIVISHEADVDGMGSIIIGKKYYGEIDYILCETKDLVDIFKEDYKNYDNIYVCDLPVDDEASKSIENNCYLKEKIKHFDHHESMIKENNPKYINEVITLDGIKTSGTHLFYNYLINKDSKLNKPFYKELVEAIRAYDVWDYTGNFKLGKRITTLFGILGINPFLDIMTSLDDNKDFELPKIYEELINNEENKMNEYIEKMNKQVTICDYEGLKCGVVISEKYRSSLGNYLCKNNDIDFAMIINFERNSCSLRCIKDDVNLGLIASKFHKHGGGHLKSAGFIIDKDSIKILKKYILDYIDNI